MMKPNATSGTFPHPAGDEALHPVPDAASQPAGREACQPTATRPDPEEARSPEPEETYPPTTTRPAADKAARHPLAAVVLERPEPEPEPDEKMQHRLRMVAKLLALHELLSALGSGSARRRDSTTDHRTLAYLREQLRQLDTLYRPAPGELSPAGPLLKRSGEPQPDCRGGEAEAYPSILVREGNRYIELPPDLVADIAGVLSEVLDDRQSPAAPRTTTPYPPGNGLTDEAVEALQKALREGRLNASQRAIVSRLWSEMQLGGFYDPEAEHPYGVVPRPEKDYAPENHNQYIAHLRGLRKWMERTDQITDPRISIAQARRLFDGLQHAPEEALREVLEEARFVIVK